MIHGRNPSRVMHVAHEPDKPLPLEKPSKGLVNSNIDKYETNTYL
jgi:hypothetical protein